MTITSKLFSGIKKEEKKVVFQSSGNFIATNKHYPCVDFNIPRSKMSSTISNSEVCQYDTFGWWLVETLKHKVSSIYRATLTKVHFLLGLFELFNKCDLLKLIAFIGLIISIGRASAAWFLKELTLCETQELQ